MPRFSRVVPSVLVSAALAAWLASVPFGALGQTPQRETGPYVGGAIGGYFESWEGGHSGRTVALTLILGHDFNARWGVRGEFGSTGDLCDPNTNCHRDRPITLSVVRRFTTGSLGFYALFGPLLPNAGLGFKIPLGRGLTVSTEFDVVYSISAIAARPKVAATLRW